MIGSPGCTCTTVTCCMHSYCCKSASATGSPGFHLHNHQMLHPCCTCRIFIGQASGKAVGVGMKQAEQKKVLTDFRAGAFNTLVATCIGEEGLDIPQAGALALPALLTHLLRSPALHVSASLLTYLLTHLFTYLLTHLLTHLLTEWSALCAMACQVEIL